MKNVKKEELKNVKGGAIGDTEPHFICKNCGGQIYPYSSEDRTVGSGCDSEVEFKCKKCGTWQIWEQK